MQAPVDLSNLRDMTDGDPNLEKELFREFYVSSETCIAALQINADPSVAETWRKSAHALKGIALNLGAQKLGDLCKMAQEEYMADISAKEALLNDIQTEYHAVKEFLLKVH
jgi:HPt (histidine-containing phosphotransfer) domain-containing protein